MTLWHREPENHLQWLAPELSFGKDWMISFETGQTAFNGHKVFGVTEWSRFWAS
jgi:hypothetical protein